MKKITYFIIAMMSWYLSEFSYAARTFQVRLYNSTDKNLQFKALTGSQPYSTDESRYICDSGGEGSDKKVYGLDSDNRWSSNSFTVPAHSVTYFSIKTDSYVAIGFADTNDMCDSWSWQDHAQHSFTLVSKPPTQYLQVVKNAKIVSTCDKSDKNGDICHYAPGGDHVYTVELT